MQDPVTFSLESPTSSSSLSFWFMCCSLWTAGRKKQMIHQPRVNMLVDEPGHDDA